MEVKIKGIIGRVLNMEAVVRDGMMSTNQREIDIIAYIVKILTPDGVRVEFKMLPADEIKVLP